METLDELVGVARDRGAPVLMAVLNTTPDSFYDGGRHHLESDAQLRIDRLLEDGAELIDIGGESTRPGSAKVSDQEQVDRVSPAIRYAVERGAIVSIDTSSARVAEEALRLGAQIVNDVSCLGDLDLAKVVLKANADLIIMHSRGSMSKMRQFSDYRSDAYGDLVADISQEWKAAEERALAIGLAPRRIWFDPGLGFHKSSEHSHEIMRRLKEFRHLGKGLVLGASRKSFLASLDGSSPERRLGGSIAACLHALSAGAAILRVHDFLEVKQAIQAFQTWKSRPSTRDCAHA